MKEILYRGKEKRTKKWIDGGYFLYKKTTYCIKEDYDAHPGNDVPCIGFNEPTDWGLPNRAIMTPIIPGTESQFIGIYDIKNVPIFEGDILKHYNNYQGPDSYDICTVVYSEDDCCFYGKQKSQSGTNFARLWKSNKYEVIGNIWDNPELEEAET